MTRLPTVIVTAVILSLAAGSAWPAGGQDDAAVVPPAVTLPADLDRVLRDYEAAWRAGDGARMASLFTEDGFAIQSGRPLARGRAEIARGLTKPGGALQLTAFAYATAGDVGHIVGGFRYPETTGPGGRFVLALRRGPDGRWLIAADLDNTGPRPR
jgi:ketosteroid isomerase-like protein